MGRVRLFISHGKTDNVLPIDRCSRVIVPQLQQAGYEVLYQEFNGSHSVPEAIVRLSGRLVYAIISNRELSRYPGKVV